MEGKGNDRRLCELFPDWNSPAGWFNIVETDCQRPAGSTKPKFLSTWGPLRAQDWQLNVDIYEHFFPFAIACSFVDEGTSIMTAWYYLIILRPVNLWDGLSLFVHFLNEFPWVNVVYFLHFKNQNLDIFFGGKGTELAWMGEGKGGEEVFLQVLGNWQIRLHEGYYNIVLRDRKGVGVKGKSVEEEVGSLWARFTNHMVK